MNTSDTILVAILTAIPIMILVPILKKYIPAKLFAATILIAMSFIYVGFAVAENTAEVIIIESIVALIFYFIAIIGYKQDSRILALGILFHGIWDSIHHFTSAAHDSPTYWPLYCFTVDLIWCIYFYMLFTASKTKMPICN